MTRDRPSVDATNAEALLDAAPFVVMEVDLEGTILRWNAAAEAVFGWSAAEVVGKPSPITGPDPADLTAERQTLTEAVVGGKQVRNVRMERLRRDGSPVVLEGSATPIFDDAGEVVSVLAAGFDVTEREQMRDELLAAQRMEAVGRVAGGVAHDFNNLLTAILGHAEFIADETPDDAPYLDDIKAIYRAARRGAALTEQLLAVGRRQMVNPEVIDVNEVVIGLRPMLRRLVGDRATLSVKTAPAPSLVEIDIAQLEQVFLNLTVNARDAMPAGGRMTIGVSNSTSGDRVLVEVRDTGVGMDAETLTHAFEPFFTTKASGQGTGLGLAAVYGIITQADGTVRAVSPTIDGVGTGILMELPRVVDRQASPPQEENTALGRGSETVLLVEDEEEVREVCRKVLERAGYTVTDAANAEEAMTMTTDFDLLVSDVVLPGADGVELATALLADRPGVPVLFITGYAEQLSEDRIPPTMRAEVLTKPFPPSELTRRVAELVARI